MSIFPNLYLKCRKGSRLLRDQDLSNGIGTGKFSNFFPRMRWGLGILYFKSRCWDRDCEWILMSPAKQARTGPYLVRGNFSLVPKLRPKTGILLQWSCEWEPDREFYISSPANQTWTGPYLFPGMRKGQESRRALISVLGKHLLDLQFRLLVHFHTLCAEIRMI